AEAVREIGRRGGGIGSERARHRDRALARRRTRAPDRLRALPVQGEKLDVMLLRELVEQRLRAAGEQRLDALPARQLVELPDRRGERRIAGRRLAGRVVREGVAQLALPVARGRQQLLERRERLGDVALAGTAGQGLRGRKDLLAEARDH